MNQKLKKDNSSENTLYNKILLLSRNKIFYTKFKLSDTFQNRIHLIFIHISFLLIKIKENKQNISHKVFYQRLFDLIFYKIELNMREIGYGDVTINKNMKLLVKNFYNILLKIERYNKLNIKNKEILLIEYLKHINTGKYHNYEELIDYFDKYGAFCFDLSSNSVLKGSLNFNYK